MLLRSGLAVLAVLALAACSGPDETVPDDAQLADELFPEVVDYRPAYPPGTCMTEEEILADQFMKLRTEMMITGLTCPAQYQDPTLFRRYVTFTADHQERIRDSQRMLGALLSRIKKGSGKRLFDTHVTEMANTESHAVSTVSTGLYCQARWQQFNAVAAFDNEDLRRYLEQAAERHRDAYDVCG